jgi:hypothetical protein
MKTYAPLFLLIVLVFLVRPATPAAGGDAQTVEITAASDNTFRVAREKSPVIRAHAGEFLRLRVTSHRGSELARDGAVHSLVIRSLRNDGWDIRLFEGTHDYEVKAPSTPGDYLIECTVKCGRGHDDMRMKLVVEK